MRTSVEQEITEVEMIRGILEKADVAGRTHMGIALDLQRAGFKLVKVDNG